MEMSAVSTPTGAVRRLGTLALAAAVYTYVLVVYGGIVRITGSGMGCGDDWPHCNAAIIPTFDMPTFIEYSHRVLAGGLALLTLWVLIQAVRIRRARAKGHHLAGHDAEHHHAQREAPRGDAARLTRPAWLAAGLILVQVLLGAITVKLELPAIVTAVHFMTAMALLAIFLVLAVRTGRVGATTTLATAAATPTAAGPALRPADSRVALAMAALGFVVITFGALTANVGMQGPFPPSGAAMACGGFPLCNGQLWPAGSSWAWIHWIHRLLAFSLLAGTAWGAWRARRIAPRGVRAAAMVTFGLVVLQIGVAAALVLMTLPEALQAAHLGVGALVWIALVLWSLLARHAERAEASAREPVIA